MRAAAAPQSHHYAWADLGGRDLLLFRSQGPGLANLLYPWARAVVAARDYGLRPIWPTWPQVKIGPILRGEPDKRFYTGLFRCPEGYLRGVAKVQAMCAPVAEEASLAALPRDGRRVRVRFSGMSGLFTPVLHDFRYLRTELLRMSRREHVAGLDAARDSVAVHVRLGDFLRAEAQALQDSSRCVRLPLDWYAEKIAAVRHVLPDIPVAVFSDGSDDELRPLLSLPGVRRVTCGSALADMLALSSASALIASGSSFSMWASYLGRMPVIWYPGKLEQRLYGEAPELEIESASGEALPESFAAAVRKRLASRSAAR